MAESSAATHMHMQKRRFTNVHATQRMAAAGLGVRPSHSLVASSRADPASILGVAEQSGSLPAADGGYLFRLTQPSACDRDGKPD